MKRMALNESRINKRKLLSKETAILDEQVFVIASIYNFYKTREEKNKSNWKI